MQCTFSRLLLPVLMLGVLFGMSQSTHVLALNPKSSIPGVHEVTEDTFSSVVYPEMKYYVLQVFYADWCSQCKNFMPDFVEFGKLYEESSEENVKSRLILSKVNAIANEELAKRYQVTSFPTIFLFFPGEEKPIAFEGRRELHYLSAFLAKNIPDFPILVAPPPAERIEHITELTEKNFESVALSQQKDVLVLFYAPWCRFCKQLLPLYQQLGEIFKDEVQNIAIARFDATVLAHREIADTYHIRGFPTLYLFPKGEGKEPILFQGKRSLTDLLRFMNANTAFPRLLDGDVSWYYGVLPDVSKELALSLYSNSQEEQSQAWNTAKDILQERKEVIGYTVYEEVLKKVSDYSADPQMFISREVQALSKRRLALPRGEERDKVTMKINIWSDLLRHRHGKRK